jgi:hypothetical protein
MKVRWRQLKQRRDWPPSEELVLVTIERDGVREVTCAYWTEEPDNWSFREWYPNHVAVAWAKMPDPFPFQSNPKLPKAIAA